MRAYKFSRLDPEKTRLNSTFSRWRNRCAFLALGLLAASAIAAADSADPKRYLDDIKALTTPAMEGRGDGSSGLTLAANLIEEGFRALGLQPAGKKSYLQPFSVITGAKLKDDNRLEIVNGAEKKALKMSQDFVPF